MRFLRHAHPHKAGGGAGFFVPFGGLRRDAFFLAYGGLGWGYADVAAMPVRTRREFVEALERQLEFERREAEKGGR